MSEDSTQNETSSASNTFTLSGFADEIDPDLEIQLDLLEELGIDYFDLRGIDDTNVLDLHDDDLERIRDAIEEHGLSVSCIGSPIGKIDITEDFEPHMERFERAIEVAKFFDVEYIRIFSYYIPEGDDPAEHRTSVMDRMRWKAKRSEESDVTLLHENEKDIYGDTAERCRDVLTTVDSPNLRAAFDPANFVEIGVEAYPYAFTLLAEYIDYLHVKDAEMGERGEIRPAGQGDGGFNELVHVLEERGFSSFASLEPHLAFAGRSTGLSGSEGFKTAVDAFRDVLDDADVNYV
ncbi:sugar phosphate isomerase/epimerase family protein [Haladaptatus caseinilyticus]|uniref:sugar phosphate isomerase/epimerase family protein n=1 Tax=Haladaptatus caseinilyticus TaxID=2993314 RepID=UPI00224AB8B4|nr:sugar phosphate isomerase/epimerase family protein [Haladaptatus caseinilyticus]